jgi:hypothetical protein
MMGVVSALEKLVSTLESKRAGKRYIYPPPPSQYDVLEDEVSITSCPTKR